jgi:catalase
MREYAVTVSISIFGSLLIDLQIPERVVHARGAGVHGVFESYGNFSNITAASFLAAEGKKTPTFVRFSTVIGERG